MPIALAVLGLGFATYVLADPVGDHKEKESPSQEMNMLNNEDVSPITPQEKLTAEGAIDLSGGMVIPRMDPVRGKALFASKGCVVCHAVNGVGSDEATAFDINDMDAKMNPFDLTAKMLNMAAIMTTLQEDELGGQIMFSGDELADIIAFLHSAEIQDTFSDDDVPDNIRKIMEAHG